MFFNGRFIIGNDYVRMYVVELRYTGGGVRSVRFCNTLVSNLQFWEIKP